MKGIPFSDVRREWIPFFFLGSVKDNTTGVAYWDVPLALLDN